MYSYLHIRFQPSTPAVCEWWIPTTLNQSEDMMSLNRISSRDESEKRETKEYMHVYIFICIVRQVSNIFFLSSFKCYLLHGRLWHICAITAKPIRFKPTAEDLKWKAKTKSVNFFTSSNLCIFVWRLRCTPSTPLALLFYVCY